MHGNRIARMITFVYSSWQRMFVCDFSPDMDGHFVLLVREDQYEVSEGETFRFHQKLDKEGHTNPYETTITARLKDITLDGEMVVAYLETCPGITAIIKLPCGAKRCPWAEGIWLKMTGELQFQVKPQLSTIQNASIPISKAKIVSANNNEDDLVICIAKDYIEKGLHSE